MKIRIVVAVSFLSCVFLASCGGGSGSSGTPTGSITSGNWTIAATSASSASFSIGGSLVQSDASVTGTMHVFDSPCFIASSDNLPLSGKFSGDTLTMTSGTLDSQVVTVKATGTGASLTGTYSVAGGCADGDHGTIVASYLPPVTGTWTSTFEDYGNTVSMSATLTQASTADANGVFPLSGAVSFSGLTCPTGGTVYSLPNSDWVTSGVVGSDILLTVENASTGNAELIYSGSITNASATQAATIAGSYTVSDASCKQLTGTPVQFTKQ